MINLPTADVLELHRFLTLHFTQLHCEMEAEWTQLMRSNLCTHFLEHQKAPVLYIQFEYDKYIQLLYFV